MLLVIKIKKSLSSITVSGITLTNDKIKDIMKVISSLVNREISLKGTIRKIVSQEGGFLFFF